MESNNATNTVGPDLGANNFGTSNNALGVDAPMSFDPPSFNVDAPLTFNAPNDFNAPNTFNAPSNDNVGAPSNISFNQGLAGKPIQLSAPATKSPPKPVPRLAFWLAIAIAVVFLVALAAVLAYFLTAKPSCASCAISGAPSGGPNGVNWVACNNEQCQGTAAITGTGKYCAVFGVVSVTPDSKHTLNGDQIRAALNASTGVDPGSGTTDTTWQAFASYCTTNTCVGFSQDATTNTYYPCLANPNGSNVTSNGTVPGTTEGGHLWTMVTS